MGPVDCTTSFLWHNSGVTDQAPRHSLCKILTHQGIHYAGIRKIHPLCILRYFIYTVTSIITNVQRAELRCKDIGSDYSRTSTWTHRLHAFITNCSSIIIRWWSALLFVFGKLTFVCFEVWVRWVIPVAQSHQYHVQVCQACYVVCVTQQSMY